MEKMTLENRFYGQESEETTHDFKEYCARRAVPENEESAGNYMNHLLREEERSHTEGLD